MLVAAVERRVAYVPGSAFYPDGRGRDQMRLAFCYPPEDRIREGIQRLGALLRDETQLYGSLRP
jgi:DNA-binding transcriptional MocR family regulator